MSDKLPNIVGYSLIRQLGQGGMGTVYFGRRESDQRPVAIKIIRADVARKEAREEFLSRFKREISVSATLAHPYVTTILDGGVTNDGLFYLVMEYIEGDPLDELIYKEKLSEQSCLQIAKQMGEALSYIHSHGVCHRDIKPANIIVLSPQRSVLVDFGLALSDDDTRITATSDVVGTFRFMAPERLQGQCASPAADIYALGVTFYYCLTNRFPYEHDSILQLAAHLKPEAPPLLTDLNSSVSLQFMGFVNKCLAIDPKERFRNAEDYLATLESLYEPAAEEKDSAPIDPAPKAKPRYSFRLVFVVLCLLISLFVLLELSTGKKATSSSSFAQVQGLRVKLLQEKGLPKEESFLEFGKALLEAGILIGDQKNDLKAHGHYDLLKRARGEKRLLLLLDFIEKRAIDWYRANRVIDEFLLAEVLAENKVARVLTLATVEQIEEAPNLAEKSALLPLLAIFLEQIDENEDHAKVWQEIEIESRKVMAALRPLLAVKETNNSDDLLACSFLALRLDYGNSARQLAMKLAESRELAGSLAFGAVRAIARVKPNSQEKIPPAHRKVMLDLLERAMPQLTKEEEKINCLIHLCQELCRVGKAAQALEYLNAHEPPENAKRKHKRLFHYRRAIVLTQLSRLDEAMRECQLALHNCETEAKRETIKSEIIRINTLKLMGPRN